MAVTSSATNITLIRHGESQVTVDRVIGGYRTCSGLSALGREQAERLRARLIDTGELAGGLLIASNFERAIETAQIIAPGLQDPDSPGRDTTAEPTRNGDAALRTDAGFGEHDPGPDLDGMPFADYVERFGHPNWGGDPHFEVFPGGETIAEFHLRVGAALARTLTEHAGERIVISCHGGVVDAIFRQLLRSAPTGLFDLWTSNTSITEFQLRSNTSTHDPRWRLVRYNDAAHLAGLPAATNPVSDSS